MIQAGERMYREGILPSGEAMRATLRGDVFLQKEQTACASCHRRSGLGSSEGGTVVPPITGAALYAPRDASVEPLAYLSSRNARRPAYADATLARAIRHGIDGARQPIPAPMPRYDLTDEEIAPLLAYLKSLSSTPSPGVTPDTIHFATVITEGAAPVRRKAMLDVFDAFFRDKNGNTRYESRRAVSGPWSMKEYRAYRKWRLHVWELKGAPETWPAQLEERYRRQPVFAILGGMAADSWRPIHTFCETNAIPCLFPATDLPVVSGRGYYTIYFSKGMTLEAQALARDFLREPSSGPVVQVHGGDPQSIAAAAAFRDACREEGIAVEERRWPGESPPAFWQALLQGKRDVRLVIWLREVDWDSLQPWRDTLKRIAVSTTLMGRIPLAPEPMAGKFVTVHPYILPERKDRQLARVRAWLRLKGIPPGDERAQADAYFAATVAADGLMRITTNFSRDYFIEKIEDMLDDALTTSLYPRLSLGPGQRFASKGVYVINFSTGENSWVVP